MEYRRLGNTELDVSVICLGSMTWGQQNTEQEGHAQLDYALSEGVNFIDTAELYSIPPKAATYGRTEEIIGAWLRARMNRDKVVLATKCAGPGESWVSHIRGGKSRFDRPNLTLALEKSLKRLQTDYVDLYQLHWPERDTNCFGELGYRYGDESFTPIEETLSVLNEFVDAGKIRYVGLSNETPWGVMSFLRTAEQLNLPRVVSIQNPYSLLNRSFEVGLAEIAIREEVGLLAYSPLAFGALSGKYTSGTATARDRLNLFPDYNRYSSRESKKATREYLGLAQEHGLSLAQMALAYVNTRSFLTSTIIGATTMDQLKEDIGSISVKLSEEVLEGIEKIHKRYPNPAP